MPTFNGRTPSAKIQGTQGTKSAEQYLQDLENLLKRNTGQGLSIAQDTSSNTPMYLPGKVRNPGGLGDMAPSIASQGQGMQQPAPVERPVPIEDQPQDIPQDTPLTIESFLGQFNQSFQAPQNQPRFGQAQQEGIGSTADGGTLTASGEIFYDDGTMRQGDPNAVGMQSLPDGSVKYSDGSVRKQAPQGIASLGGSNRERILYNDGSARYGNYEYQDGQPVNMPGGTPGLISGLFGQNRDITQQFGNYNPSLEPGSGYNMGTDIRTRDLSGQGRELKLPVGAEVVQVLQDDGTRFGDRSGHQGYGNSVLVKLATGEMLRFSHLAQPVQFQPGQRIEAGQVFGTPGQTGNTTGEHLDLEYYDRNGQIANPQSFSGFTDPQGLRTPVPGQPAPGTLVNQSQPSQPSQPQPQQSQPQQNQSAPQQNPTMVTDAVKQIPQRVQQATQAVQRAPGQVLGASIEKLNPTGDYGLGISEIAKGDVPAAGREASNTIEKLQPTGKRIDFGGSELLRGDIQGAKANFTDTASRIGNRLGRLPGQIADAITPQAFASDGQPQSRGENLSDNINYIGDTLKNKATEELAQAGQGLQNLKNTGADILGNVFKPQQQTQKRAIGDVAGTTDLASGTPSSLMDSAPSMSKVVPNDIRDSFFKNGGANDYKNFLKPGAIDNSGGALSLDLFSDSFFQDPNNIQKVFGGTYLAPQAQEKYNLYTAEQARQNSSQPQESLDDYIRKGKTAAQYYAETGQQGTADQIRKSGGSLEGNSSPGNANYSAPSGQAVYIPPTPQSKNNKPVASGTAQNYTPANANYSSPSGTQSYIAPPRQSPAQSSSQPQGQQSRPSTNIFSKALSSLYNVFRR